MGDLREFVAADDPIALLDALHLASGMSVSAVRDQLDYDFLESQAEAGSTFLRAWVAKLAPFERMQAVRWVAGEYLLSMCHLDHAYGIGARLELEAFTAVTDALAASLEGFEAFTDGPDAEVGGDVTETLKGLAATVRGVSAQLADEVSRLPSES